MPIPAIFAPLIQPIINKGLDVIDQFVEDKDQAAKLKHELETQTMQMDFAYLTAWINAQKEVLKAELTGDSWLGKNWRPLLMLTFGLIIFNNYALYPYLSMFTDKAVKMDIPTHMWELLKIGVGGYIVGRSAEKVAKTLKEKNILK